MLKKDQFSPTQIERLLNEKFKGNKTFIDIVGRKTTRENAVVVHIVPVSKGGKPVLKNGLVLHRKTAEEKDEKLSGTIGSKNNPYTFKVNKHAVTPKMNVREK